MSNHELPACPNCNQSMVQVYDISFCKAKDEREIYHCENCESGYIKHAAGLEKLIEFKPS